MPKYTTEELIALQKSVAKAEDELEAANALYFENWDDYTDAAGRAKDAYIKALEVALGLSPKLREPSSPEEDD